MSQVFKAQTVYKTKAKIRLATIKPFPKDSVDEGCRLALFVAISEDINQRGHSGAICRSLQFPGWLLRRFLHSLKGTC